MSKKYTILVVSVLFLCSAFATAQENIENTSLEDKYLTYRNRLLDEWIIVSDNVEQFGVNIPAVDRRIDENDNVTWISWSDGNSNFNHWLGILSTEYRLLKNNNQNYQETLKLLLYSMLSIERLDLYSEYALRFHHGITKEGETNPGFVDYPSDINGFLIRDDVSLGFWLQYHEHFNSKLGNIISSKDGTSTYLSVFQKGVIPKQGMSQDNISYMLQSLALVKHLVDNEDISNINYAFYNSYIPDYLKSKDILRNDSVYFDRWVDDITDRLLKHVTHRYPEPKITLKPKENFKARLYKTPIGGFLSSYWYVMNPVTNDLVAEGNGEDMGVWMNSYGMAEAANTITGKNIYHNDGSDRGLSKYIFKALLFKELNFLGLGSIPLPPEIDDYMLRALATIADLNWNKNSYSLLYLLSDKREKYPYEHNPLILFALHKEKYEKIYKPETELYETDKKYYEELLNFAPASGPSTDYRRIEYSPYWSTSSRLNWPPEPGGKRDTSRVVEYAGMDYMFLYNLYRIVFEPDNYKLGNYNSKEKKSMPAIMEYRITEMKEPDLQYFYMPPKQK